MGMLNDHGNGVDCMTVRSKSLIVKLNVHVGNDQEMAIEKRNPTPKPRWEKTKLTIRYLLREHIVSRMSSYFPIDSSASKV